MTVGATRGGEVYEFQTGDLVRLKVTEKKKCENVVLQKDFPVTAPTQVLQLRLTGQDTKIGNVISRPVDYWYEVELNPLSHPQTIIGYDEEGPKIFKLLPEGRDLSGPEIKPEDIPLVDGELDLGSSRPVQNQAVAREVLKLRQADEKLGTAVAALKTKDQELQQAVEQLQQRPQVCVGPLKPAVGPALWVQTAQLDPGGNYVVTTTAEPPEGHQITADIEGNTYGFPNMTANKGPEPDTYDFTVR